METVPSTPASLMRRHLAGMLGGVCAGTLLPWPSQVASAAGGRELHVLGADDSPVNRQIVLALKARLTIPVIEVDVHSAETRQGGALHVALGPQALKQALAADIKSPLLSLFTSSQTYRQLVAQGGAALRDRGLVSAIYAEAPPLAQLQLIGALFERRVNVGVLLSEASGHLERPLQQAAAQVGIDLMLERVNASSDVVRALSRFTGLHALLMVPDSTLYTADSLRAMLESTYRRRLPVIGFSPATVSAGTLAAAHAGIDDVVADLADVMEAWAAQTSSALPDPRFPRYWRVAVNESVARSLGVPISDKVRQLGRAPSGGAR
jgi:putative ABC transport system substrate-binding protein